MFFLFENFFSLKLRRLELRESGSVVQVVAYRD